MRAYLVFWSITLMHNRWLSAWKMHIRVFVGIVCLCSSLAMYITCSVRTFRNENLCVIVRIRIYKAWVHTLRFIGPELSILLKKILFSYPEPSKVSSKLESFIFLKIIGIMVKLYYFDSARLIWKRILSPSFWFLIFGISWVKFSMQLFESKSMDD